MSGAPPTIGFAVSEAACSASMTTFIFGIVVTISDDMATMSASCSLRGGDERLRRHVDAEVEDGEPGAVEHERHEALADVVDVALDGADDDRPAAARRLDGEDAA